MKFSLFISTLILAATTMVSAATGLGVQAPLPTRAVSGLIPVELTSNDNPVAMQVDALFNEDLYEVSEVAQGDQPEGVKVFSRQVEPGVMRVVAYHRANSSLVNDVLFYLPLRAKTGVVADDPIVLTNYQLSGASGQSISTRLLPKIRLQKWREGQKVNGRLGIEFTATASATDATITKVEYYVGGVLIGEGTGPHFSLVWNPPSNGPFEVVVIAYDSQGQQASTRTTPLVVGHIGTYAGAVVGTYHGLLRGERFQFSRDGYLTMTTTTTRTFTLKMIVGGKELVGSGRFNESGNATINVSRGVGIKPLTVVLAHSSQSTVDQIHGRVADGAFDGIRFAGHTFESEFIVNRLVWNAVTRVAPQNGTYTLLMPKSASSNFTNNPIGTGSALLTVGKNGSARITASLADGSALTASSFVSKNGEWPIYAPLYLQKGVLLGELNFQSFEGIGDVSGLLTWFRPVNNAALSFKPGFTTELPAIGGRYRSPLANQRILAMSNIGGNAFLSLKEGGLPERIDRLATLNSLHSVQIPLQGAEQATLKPDKATGLLTGTFLHPVTQKSVTYRGAVLLNQNLAAGYFSGGTRGGDVSFSPNPNIQPSAEDADPIGSGVLPIVKIAAPISGSTLGSTASNAVIARGTASDAQGIQQIWVQHLHNGVLSPPALATGTTAWTHSIPIPAGQGGHFTVFAKAIDTLGNESNPVMSQFWISKKEPLVVNVAGPGRINTGFKGTTSREIGKLITLTAVPNLKKKFLGWTGTVQSRSTKITFMMKQGTVITATFGN